MKCHRAPAGERQGRHETPRTVEGADRSPVCQHLSYLVSHHRNPCLQPGKSARIAFCDIFPLKSVTLSAERLGRESLDTQCPAEWPSPAPLE